MNKIKQVLAHYDNLDNEAIKLTNTAYCVTLNGKPSGTSQLL